MLEELLESFPHQSILVPREPGVGSRLTAVSLCGFEEQEVEEQDQIREYFAQKQFSHGSGLPLNFTSELTEAATAFIFST